MTALVRLVYVFAPVQIFLVYVGLTPVTVGLALSVLLAGVGAVELLRCRFGVHPGLDRPYLLLAGFVGSAALGLLLSPYGAAVQAKGIANLLAIGAMLLMAFAATRTVEERPGLFLTLLRLSMIVIGAAGLLGVWQSFTANVLGAPELFDLTAISRLSGIDWWYPAVAGGITRASSFYFEPAHLAGHLGLAAGPALMRLGAFGRGMRAAVAPASPLWASLAVLACLLLTFSVVCYLTLLAVIVAGLFCTGRISARMLGVGLVSLGVLLLGLWLAAGWSGGLLLDRLVGLTILARLGDAAGPSLDPLDINLSAAILFLNVEVALTNFLSSPLLGGGLGSHPLAYETSVSAHAWLPQEAVGYNAQDAASLLLRLLSETGIVGTVLFFTAMAALFLSARAAVLAAAEARRVLSPGTAAMLAGAVAVNASFGGVMVAYAARMPFYYSPSLWTLIALAAAIPPMLRRLGDR